MFSKTLKFTDFNGKEQEKVFWFHLSNAKLAMLSADGKLKTWAESMLKEQDPAQILDKIRYLVKLACGIRSEDGQRFIQTEEAQSELLDSPAFDELLFELFVGKNAVEFFNALVPPEQQKQIEELAKKQGVVDPFKETDRRTHSEGSPESEMPAYQRERRRPTQKELMAMSREEMQEAFAWSEQKLPIEVQK
jgi:hypothetical protein